MICNGRLSLMMHVNIVASQAQPAVFDTVWPDEHACAQAAGRWAQALQPHLSQQGSVVVHLHGTLGAGKTTFTRHLLRALGVQGRIKSPSYAVVEPHETPCGSVQHFDFYRFNDPSEWEDAGFRDLFAAPGLKLVEWPLKAGELLPAADAELHLTPPAMAVDAHADASDADANDATSAGTGEPRQVRVVARSPMGQALMAAWQSTEAAHG